MIETILLIAIIFIFLISILIAVPYYFKNVTEAENDSNHIYNVFMEEAGWRARRVVCAIGCFLPISIFINHSMSIETIGLSLVFICYCLYEHLQLYRGVKIFDFKMFVYLILVVLFHAFLNVIYLYKNIGNTPLIILTMMSSLFWGFLVNVKRSKILREEKFSM